jgi:hypothetical protein
MNRTQEARVEARVEARCRYDAPATHLERQGWPPEIVLRKRAVVRAGLPSVLPDSDIADLDPPDHHFWGWGSTVSGAIAELEEKLQAASDYPIEAGHSRDEGLQVMDKD